jgi:hypothetical protein
MPLGFGIVYQVAFAFGVGIYFLPTIVALARHAIRWPTVAVVNVLLGWSLIGWAVALVMAFRTTKSPRS